QRHRVAGVGVAVDRVQADHLAGEVEAQHVLAAVAVDDIGLHRARAHRGDRLERVADAEHVLAGMQRADVLDQHVQVLQRRLVHALRQAGLRERAGGAEGQLVAVVGEHAGAQARERGIAHAQAFRAVRWRGRSAAWRRRRRWVAGSGRSTWRYYATTAVLAWSR